MNAPGDPAALSIEPTDAPPAARAAATVVVAREGDGGFEVLLLQRSDVGAFGGMWVFPGGRVDDGDAGDDDLARAASAAVRESAEEAGLDLDPAQLIPLSHWTPPAMAQKRFTTWFFVAHWAGDDVVVDGHEIVDARWIAPGDALEAGLPLAPPTYVTLSTLHEAGSFVALREMVEAQGVEHFVTRLAPHEGDLIMMWQRDAGYETNDPTVAGARHRIRLRQGTTLEYERSDG